MKTVTPSALGTLRQLLSLHGKKLVWTFSLVLAENILLVTYPLFAGFAINAMIQGNLLTALVYALVVLGMWGVGAARRSVDTRTFSRIYAKLAVPVILSQRSNQQVHSTIAARVALSREFVDFFETHLPVLLTTIISIVGAALMLMVLEPLVGVGAVVMLAVFSACLPRFARINNALYFRLNNRLEKEVGFVGVAKEYTLSRHYMMMARLRIRLSDREAWGYMAIGIASAILFGTAIIILTGRVGLDAGHIYSVMTYLWMFAMSLDDAPQLVDQYSKLKDIGKRVNTGLG
ncbi:ABC transporter six-transmembrane domain-containing protein [Yersinia bercovieri]|uniref:ABC transporter six-transmembrane domain-containing protein n=1 Tax=Yersinia bercovieri TaxID=634 RepID=UPI0011A5B8A1|nr:ABC transporter six-transmembrane domain-containing protein [Yersinia bercovieri]